MPWGTEHGAVSAEELRARGALQSEERRGDPGGSPPRTAPGEAGLWAHGPRPSARSRFKDARSLSPSGRAEDAAGRFRVTPPGPWRSPRRLGRSLTSAARPAPRPPQPMGRRSAPRATPARARSRQSSPARGRPQRHWLPRPPVSPRPVPPRRPRQPRSIQLHSLSPRRRRQQGRGGLVFHRDSRALPDGRRASAPAGPGGGAHSPLSSPAPPD